MQQTGAARAAAALGGSLWLLASGLSLAQAPGTADWPHPGGDAGGGRYSPLADIHRGNVSELEVVWTYRHGDVYEPEGYEGPSGTSFEATPLLVEGKVIVSTPYNRVIALDPESGAELWVFDPRMDRTRRYPHGFLNRGVEYWRDPDADGFCASRIFVATTDSRLIAIDVETGEVVHRFELPASLHAGPITYKLQPDGKQYLLVTPGGHMAMSRYQEGSRMGDWVIAYALPD